MAASTSRSVKNTKLQHTQSWREQREISPERTVVWTEPHNHKLRKVPVLYYLSRNGQLEHPHFMEVPLSSPHGLFLSDVITRLDALRGKGMASMYSWSCKRPYKNGYVWQDLTDNDLIYPAHAHEYVLKGSELPENAFLDTSSPSTPRQPPPEIDRSGGDDQDCPRAADTGRRNRSCSSIDSDIPGPADVSTQAVDNHRRGRRRNLQAEDEIEISTPPSDSSPETLQTLMKADGRVALQPETVGESSAATAAKGGRNHQIQRFKSSVLMQFISCGAMSFKDCGDGPGLGFIGPYKIRGPRGGGTAEMGGGKLGRKEYFSGSLVETKKEEFPNLRRSTSYNADRRPYLEIADKEIEGVKGKCIPTKPRSQCTTRKQNNLSL